MSWSRAQLSEHVAIRLEAEQDALQDAWRSADPIGHFIVDDLLPNEQAHAIASAFPDPGTLMQRNSWRERKRVGVQVDEYAPIISEILYAFQEARVLRVIEAITAIADLDADPSLYASGLSVMTQGDFLHPHLDNSHDGDNRLYRVLNLLYYASPDWAEGRGGDLELWDPEVRTPTPLPARFNRLVVMATHRKSWHSVNRIEAEAARRCVSNYYFSPHAPGGIAHAHVTSFAGRPEQPWLRAFMGVDRVVLNLAGRVMPWLTTRNKHRVQDES